MFQWQFNSTNVTGAISNRLTLTNVTLAHLGVYQVTVLPVTSAWSRNARVDAKRARSSGG